MSELSVQELELLARGYNWLGDHAVSFEALRLAIARAPHSFDDLLRSAGVYARNAFCDDLPGFVSTCDMCIATGLGPAAFWNLLKADQYIAFATGEHELEDFEWSSGHPILHPEWLLSAAESLEAALAPEPEAREKEPAGGCIRLLPGSEHDWNKRFAAVLREPMFSHLTQ